MTQAIKKQITRAQASRGPPHGACKNQVHGQAHGNGQGVRRVHQVLASSETPKTSSSSRSSLSTPGGPTPRKAPQGQYAASGRITPRGAQPAASTSARPSRADGISFAACIGPARRPHVYTPTTPRLGARTCAQARTSLAVRLLTPRHLAIDLRIPVRSCARATIAIRRRRDGMRAGPPVRTFLTCIQQPRDG